MLAAALWGVGGGGPKNWSLGKCPFPQMSIDVTLQY